MDLDVSLSSFRKWPFHPPLNPISTCIASIPYPPHVLYMYIAQPKLKYANFSLCRLKRWLLFTLTMVIRIYTKPVNSVFHELWLATQAWDILHYYIPNQWILLFACSDWLGIISIGYLLVCKTKWTHAWVITFPVKFYRVIISMLIA